MIPATASLVRASRVRPAPRGPSLPGPTLLPKNRTPRQLYLLSTMWLALKKAAKFHTAAFKLLGSTEGVSRNDLIESFLTWALDEYWKDKGGEPEEGSPAWNAAVEKFAQRLRKLAASNTDSE